MDIKHDERAFSKLKTSKVIAVVGISPNKERPSYYTTEKVVRKGTHKVYMVNPKYAGQEILGHRVYSSLSEVPEKIDIVNVYRNPAHIEEVVKEAIDAGARIVWLQPGAENYDVIERYKGKIDFVYNACIGIEAGYL